ncbi:hypothetical protein BN12_790017 [Nostocoides japonicum T1-X7]|uniref:Uncharacterized protein n=1 Tax=Nostocoides japonicum T1-X7 TaxID=1194083 RepID=A0A077M1L5_9MICO|nr:hypothetical protein [Tetrasphaera japonica]CCH80188.1 hypothetical protein BN12_790017 [Tetrasphaera japonica T1-X7]
MAAAGSNVALQSALDHVLIGTDGDPATAKSGDPVFQLGDASSMTSWAHETPTQGWATRPQPGWAPQWWPPRP